MFNLLFCTLCVHFLGNLETYVVRFSEFVSPVIQGGPFSFMVHLIGNKTIRLFYKSIQSVTDQTCKAPPFQGINK